MIEEADGVDRDATIRCDLCIVGAGPAGITLAERLQGSGLDVVLLESGGTDREPATQDLYRGEVRGAPQFPLDLSRLRFLGGTSNHWAGMCRPFDPIDFARRDFVPDSGWPIGRADLDDDYRLAHEILDLGVYDYSREAWPEAGDPGPRLDAEPDVVFKVVQHSTPPLRFRKKYDDLLRAQDGPRVLLHANAYELVPDADGRYVERLAVRTLAGNRFDVVARRYVLATGGIENARLLLLSSSVVPDGLGNAHGLVGRYYMDHPGAIPFGVLLFSDPSYERLSKRYELDGLAIEAGLSLGDEALARRRLLNHAVYMRQPMTVEGVKDFEWFNVVQTISGVIDERDLEWVGFLERLSAGDPGAKASICWIRSEQAPVASSRVMLGDDRDALGQRRVVVDWRLSDENRRTFVEAAGLWAEILTRSGVGRVKLMSWLLENEDEWWRRITPGWHHIGTTRMSDDPRQGVVDRNGRVHGLANLYVAGSSVFPTSSYINPTLTIVALAVGLARHLRAEFAREGIA